MVTTMTTKPCPFCAEPILAEAKKCRHCQSMLVDAQGRPFVVGVAGGNTPSVASGTPGQASPVEAPPPAPSLWSLMFANLLCPGLGTWRLGRRTRGLLIGGGLLLAVLLYAQDALPIYMKVMEKAMKGNLQAFSADQQALLDGIIWHKIAVGLFIYSFVDVYLVHRETHPGT